MIVDDLKNRYLLPILLERFAFSKSSHYYQKAVMRKTDKFEGVFMREENLVVNNKRRKNIIPTKRELSHSVPNKIAGDFHANKPNKK